MAALLIGALLGGCSREKSAGATDRPRIVLFAVDGFEWDVALPLLREGRLPHLAALAERGVYGRIRSIVPTVSPAVWTTAATGKGIEKHGIYHFRRRDGGPGAESLFNSTHRKTKAFWNILTDYGLRIHSIGWFLTYPVEPINGVMISHAQGIGKPEWVKTKRSPEGKLIEGMKGQVWPVEREREMFDCLRRSDEKMPELIETIFGERLDSLDEVGSRLFRASRWAFRNDETYVAIAEKLAVEGPFDLMTVYMGGTDVAGHRFWRYYRPDRYDHPPSEGELKKLARIIPSYYVHVDDVIGRLETLLGDSTTVVVLSDHGMRSAQETSRFEPADPSKLVSGRHTTNAVFFAAGPAVRRAARSASWDGVEVDDLPVLGDMVDITPTLLSLLQIPVGRDMDGKALDTVIDPAYARQHPTRFIDTHDTKEWLEMRRAAAKILPGREERWEELRALGYLD